PATVGRPSRSVTTNSSALETAFAHHARGELAQAQAIYRQIVASDPGHAAAWHLLGVAAHQEGRHAEAVEHLSRAIALDAAQPDFHNHLGTACAALGDLERAELSFRHALGLSPADGQIHYNLATLLNLRGRPDEAIALYRRAIELAPSLAEAHFNLGNLLRERGDLAAAEPCFAAAVRARPGYAKALTNLAAVSNKLGKRAQARSAWQTAVDVYRRTLASDPRNIAALTGLGASLQGLEKFADARACYGRALELEPKNATALFNLASALFTEGDYRQAEAYFRRAATGDVDHGDVAFRLGQCRQFDGDFSAAIDLYDQALERKPAEAEFHYYRATARLASGDFEQGWPEYEWRLKTRYAGPAYPQRRWQGEALDGDKIVVYAEWGLGDTLQFVRYVPQVEARGGEVVLAVQEALVPLLRESGFKQFAPWQAGAALDCQWQVPLLSLPGIFRTLPTTIPQPNAYLTARPDLVERWRQRLDALSGLKVGIHWHGSKSWTTDLRSIPLAEFEPLSRLGGVTLISLQKDDGTGQLQQWSERLGIVDFGKELDAEHGAFMDTAAIMRSLDVTITCDTAIAHVGGALGTKVWVALPRAGEWRWMWDREDSPWYRTMRLFRQDQPHDWRGVFERIADRLTELAGTR
ncbi:MAG TPA: tetratricopeptide repeat protein, partial [Pirellulales bacterium]|nr:tetratricopeptide repeat protein [Pirellulales bacterium]